MFNLYLLNESFTNGLNYSTLNFISLASILCGVFVIVSKNPIVSVLFLIGLFLNIAGFLMMLGINFIGLSYLLVYVGAVSILFIFILMLINVRISELVTDSSNSIPLAIIIGIFFNITLYKLFPSNMSEIDNVYVYSGNRSYYSILETGNDAISVNSLFYSMKTFFNAHDNNSVLFVSSQI